MEATIDIEEHEMNEQTTVLSIMWIALIALILMVVTGYVSVTTGLTFVHLP